LVPTITAEALPMLARLSPAALAEAVASPVSVSPAIAGFLLGSSPERVRRACDVGLLQASGRVHRLIDLGALEVFAGRSFKPSDWTKAITRGVNHTKPKEVDPGGPRP
jgi:hypothetical protein